MTDADFVRHLAQRGLIRGADADRLHRIAKASDSFRFLLGQVLESDMAQRAEDEGEVDPLLDEIRSTLEENHGDR